MPDAVVGREADAEQVGNGVTTQSFLGYGAHGEVGQDFVAEGGEVETLRPAYGVREGPAGSGLVRLGRNVVGPHHVVCHRGQQPLPFLPEVGGDLPCSVELTGPGRHFLAVVAGGDKEGVHHPVRRVGQMAAHHDGGAVLRRDGEHLASAAGADLQQVADGGVLEIPGRAALSLDSDESSRGVGRTIHVLPGAHVVPVVGDDAVHGPVAAGKHHGVARAGARGRVLVACGSEARPCLRKRLNPLGPKNGRKRSM